MTTLLLHTTVALMSLAASFDLRSWPIETGEAAYVFAAQGDGVNRAALYVLEDKLLRILDVSGAPGKESSRKLFDDVSMVDVFDLDGDTQGELLMLAGNTLYCAELFGAQANEAPRVLFHMDNAIVPSTSKTYPSVLAMLYDNRMLLALPGRDALEIRTLRGEMVETFPWPDVDRHQIGFDSPGFAFTSNPPMLGGPDAVEVRINRFIEYQAALPMELNAASTETRGMMSLHEPVSVDASFAQWPWLPLYVVKTPQEGRILYQQDDGDTKVRIWRLVKEEKGNGDVRVGSERRYPGTLIDLDDAHPDFNGDGIVDLLLWRAPEPGVSMDSITRAVTSGTWPLTMTIHLFNPKGERHDAAAAFRLDCRVPVFWFLGPTGDAPVHCLNLDDLNGDRRSDLGCLTGPSEYSIWLTGSKGIAIHPDYVAKLSTPVLSMACRADFGGKGLVSVVLRGEKEVYVLTPGEDARMSPPDPNEPVNVTKP